MLNFTKGTAFFKRKIHRILNGKQWPIFCTPSNVYGIHSTNLTPTGKHSITMPPCGASFEFSMRHWSHCSCTSDQWHDDVIKWKNFPRYWSFVRGIHRSPVNSPHKGQWHGALVFSLLCARINGYLNNLEAGDLRRHRAHYYVTVMVDS